MPVKVLLTLPDSFLHIWTTTFHQNSLLDTLC